MPLFLFSNLPPRPTVQPTTAFAEPASRSLSLQAPTALSGHGQQALRWRGADSTGSGDPDLTVLGVFNSNSPEVRPRSTLSLQQPKHAPSSHPTHALLFPCVCCLFWRAGVLRPLLLLLLLLAQRLQWSKMTIIRSVWRNSLLAPACNS